jgi:hypothetical protein
MIVSVAHRPVTRSVSVYRSRANTISVRPTLLRTNELCEGVGVTDEETEIVGDCEGLRDGSGDVRDWDGNGDIESFAAFIVDDGASGGLETNDFEGETEIVDVIDGEAEIVDVIDGKADFDGDSGEGENEEVWLREIGECVADWLTSEIFYTIVEWDSGTLIAMNRTNLPRTTPTNSGENPKNETMWLVSAWAKAWKLRKYDDSQTHHQKLHLATHSFDPHPLTNTSYHQAHVTMHIVLSLKGTGSHQTT